MATGERRHEVRTSVRAVVMATLHRLIVVMVTYVHRMMVVMVTYVHRATPSHSLTLSFTHSLTHSLSHLHCYLFSLSFSVPLSLCLLSFCPPTLCPFSFLSLFPLSSSLPSPPPSSSPPPQDPNWMWCTVISSGGWDQGRPHLTREGTGHINWTVKERTGLTSLTGLNVMHVNLIINFNGHAILHYMCTCTYM